MTIAEIRNILEAPYDRKVWKTFIQTAFSSNEMIGIKSLIMQLANVCF